MALFMVMAVGRGRLGGRTFFDHVGDGTLVTGAAVREDLPRADFVY